MKQRITIIELVRSVNQGGSVEKSIERRKDVGLKVLYGIFFLLISFLLSIIFFETYRKAEASLINSGRNETEIAVLKETNKNINKNLDSMNCKLDMLLGYKN